MKPFLVFRAPEHVQWRFIPRGKKYFRVNIWVKRPFQKHQEVNDFRIKEAITIEQLHTILEMHANELMDIAQSDLYEHWAVFYSTSMTQLPKKKSTSSTITSPRSITGMNVLFGDSNAR